LSGVPLKMALLQLARDYDLKFIVSNDVPDLEITCFAKDTPISSVLEDITTQVKATYSYRDGKIYIYTFGTKLFKVCLPNLTHSYSSYISTSGYSGVSTTTTEGNTSTATTTSSSEAGPNTEVKIKVEEIKVYDEIEKNLKSILSKDGKYGINKNTGIITITDYAENLAQAEKFLIEVNKEFSKQVYLKVRIAEVELKDQYASGINWNYLSSNFKISASSNFSLVQSGNTFVWRSNESPDAGTKDKGVSILLKALEEFGKVNIVSQPSLAVLNTQPASIQVGAVKNYVSSMTQETTQIGILTGFGVSQVAEGLTLSLIPKINEDGKVFMSLIPTIKEVSEIRTIPVGGGQIEAPNVSTRALTTSVMAQAGDTIILGGLMKEREDVREQRTPILGKIPILKYLFSQKTKQKSKNELVLLLTIEEVK